MHQQIAVDKRTVTRPKLRTTDRLFWVGLARVWAGWRHSLVIVTPDTVLCWQRRRFREYWTKLSDPVDRRSPVCQRRDRTSWRERRLAQTWMPRPTLFENLAALVPRPRINLVLYHGVLAPHSDWRARVVAYGAAPVAASGSGEMTEEPSPVGPRCWAWADLMRRAFDIDVLACPRCGGRLRLIATVEDPDAIRAILVAGAGSGKLADRAPPFAPAPNTSHAAAIGV